MLIQLLVAAVVTMINIAIHAYAMSGVVYVDNRNRLFAFNFWPMHGLALRMILVVAVLNVAHLAEVGVWAVAYDLFDVIPNDGHPFYFAFVNFATLGYGDTLPSPNWRLVGPATAMNGIMLLGWSTAVIFSVLTRFDTDLIGGRDDGGDKPGS